MKQEELIKLIADLEDELAVLPKGSITKKNVNGKDYYYLRTTVNGTRKEKYLNFNLAEEYSKKINRRKSIEKELRRLKDEAKKFKVNELLFSFNTTVRYGESLKKMLLSVKDYKKRYCFKELKQFCDSDLYNKVFIIYGLRRTGKTTLMRQMLAELLKEEFEKAAFIQITAKDTLADLSEDLNRLQKNGYKYIFIDEVTLLEDFIEGAAMFSDIYASTGMKIILSGTDSLGFVFTEEEELYDRCILLHTTFIPYREFEEVLGIKGIDEYIRYGGTMSLSGINYNSSYIFKDSKSTNEYIDTAIARNIQHSLKMYKYGGHFRELIDLYEANELTNVINRVIEDINHRFTKSVVEEDFISHDIKLTAKNLLKDRISPVNINNYMDLDAVTEGIKLILDILNVEEQSVDISNAHLMQIKEYLVLLDLIKEIDVEYLPDVFKKNSITVISQPGMRYAQATTAVENLLLDSRFMELSAIDRKRILDRLKSEISGRMMEEIVLLETALAKPDKYVFKLEFAIGEFDMVVSDRNNLTQEIYEIKYSREQVDDQYKHLINKDKCDLAEHRFGTIENRYVIYRGENKEVNGIKYLNVEDYLKSLR